MNELINSKKTLKHIKIQKVCDIYYNIRFVSRPLFLCMLYFFYVYIFLFFCLYWIWKRCKCSVFILHHLYCSQLVVMSRPVKESTLNVSFPPLSTRGAKRHSGMTSAHGRTPMYGSQTPMYGTGSRTPMYGSQTPLLDGTMVLLKHLTWCIISSLVRRPHGALSLA